MCRKLVMINELFLGSRQLGVEVYSLPKGEVIEYTTKQLKDAIRSGVDEVYGVVINEETNELMPDTENFFCTNWMVKSHINSLVPRFESDSLVNLFYIVLGTHKEKGNLVYDVISSRYERTSFTEEKIKTLLDMHIISAGARMNGDTIEVAPLEKPKASTEENATVKEKDTP